MIQKTTIPSISTFRYSGFVVLAVLLALPLMPMPAITSPSWLAFIGRLHPILLHFPIALIPVLTIFELFAFWKKMPVEVPYLRVTLWLGSIAIALLAAAAGYLLMASGEYGGELAQQHFWGAIGFTCLLIAAALFRFAPSPTSRIDKTSLGFLVAANLALLYTGHHGGALTHGASFLTEALPVGQALPPSIDKPREDMLVLEDLILPALDLRCVSCHNDNKSKGDLKLTSFMEMQNGGKSGNPLLVAGTPEESELFHRITLPREDDDFMPPDGKTPLREVEVALIQWWIEAGASPDMKYATGPEDSALALQLNAYIPTLQRTRAKRAESRQAFREQLADFQALAAEIGLVATVDPDSDSSLFAVSMQLPPSPVDDNTVAALVEYADAIGSLSLAASDISDDALYHIQRMTNLGSLSVTHTPINGDGLVYLNGFNNLSRINLSHTALTSANALHLLSMPALKEIYLFGTTIDPAVVDALQDYLGADVIRIEEGPH